MDKPIPSPFNASSIEDEVHMAIEAICTKLGIDQYFFMYSESNGEDTSIWRATSNHMCDQCLENMVEAGEHMIEHNDTTS